MIAYEFETEIQNGIIKIPDNYKGEKTGKFKIIMIPQKENQEKLKQVLLDTPVWNDDDVKEFEERILKGYKNWTPEEL